MRLRFGVIGYGYWGPNLARTIMQSETLELAMVADFDQKRRSLAARYCPGVEVTKDPVTLITDRTIDVVAIATPISSHYRLALAALRAGKHVFIEKPLASSVSECEHLLSEAVKRNLVVFVDHTFVYTGAVRKIHELISGGELGKVMYYDTVRINLGLFQEDANVIWDLAVHDFAILDYIMPQQPVAVSALGARPVEGHQESIAYVTLFYPDEVIAHVHASWLAPVKIRQTLIGGTRRMLVYNDLEPSEKIKVYNRGIEFPETPDQAYRFRVGYRSGDMLAPQIDLTEALKTAIEHAGSCIVEGQDPITGGAAGHRVVRLLEAATASMRDHGRIVTSV